MSTARLLTLVTTLLVLAAPTSAFAEAELDEAHAAEQVESHAGDEPALAGEAPAAPEAAVASDTEAPAPAAMPEATSPDDPQWAAEGGDPAATAPAEAPAAEPVADDVPALTLGMVGYDSQGRQGRLHVVSPGDTLWDISDAYLGTPWVWPNIWQDNRDIANPHVIYPNDRIWITPWEMRKVSPEEAEALLAGQPAAAEEAPLEEVPAPEIVEPTPTAEVIAERPTVRIFERESVGLISGEDLDASASIVSTTSSKTMLAQGDRVYVGLGEGDVVKGDRFTVFKANEKVFDPETRDLLGYHVELLGWLEILEPGEETSVAEIVRSQSEINVGHRLIPRVEPVTEIPVLGSPEGVDGQVSFLAHSRTMMGTIDYVYVNRGTLDGIEIGSPLQVYRKGFQAREQVRDENVAVGDRKIADLLVVKAEPETSVALVRHTEEEISLGDHVRGASPR